MKHSQEIAVAPMDVTGIPTNPMHEHLERYAATNPSSVDPQDIATLNALRAAYREAPNKNTFHSYNRKIWDLSQKYPAVEPEESRDKIDFTPKRLGTVPIIITNSVNLGLRVLLAGPRYGSTGTVMQEKNIQDMDRKLTRYAPVLRGAHPLYREFCALSPDAEVDDYWHYIQRYEDDFAIVVDATRDHFNRDADFLGIVGPDEVKKAKGIGHTPIWKVMKSADKVLTAPVGINARGAVNLLDSKEKSFLPIVDGKKVVGVTSLPAAGYSLRFGPHMDTDRGGLAFFTAIRYQWRKHLNVIEQWIAERKVGKGLRIDRAHFDRGTEPFRFIEELRKLIDRLDPTLELHAGNVATGEGALRIADAGATGVWVGVGPSPVCLTRVKTNSGVPQITATENARHALDSHGYDDVILVSDGGVQDTPAHSVAVLRAGADFVGGSTSPSKTRESAPMIRNFENKDKSKRRILASGNASNLVQLDPQPHAKETDAEIYRRTQGPRREGDTRVVSMDPHFETIREFLVYQTDGETSGVSYAGGNKLKDLHLDGQAMLQTTAGQQEGQSRIDGAAPEN